VIYHVAGADNDWTPKAYLKSWGRALAPTFRSIHTHQLAEVRELPVGTYLFTDLEKQTPRQRAIQGQVWDQLARGSDSVRLLNHPGLALGRHALLQALHQSGSNRYRALKLNQVDDRLRFPVFLRNERDHEGARTPLIDSWGDLEEQLLRLLSHGVDEADMLVVEFCDTADADGIYRKYSAFRVGERIVPRHLIFGREWMLKYPDLLQSRMLEEERVYLSTNPHEEELRGIFDLARLDYGRIDYALLDGQIQVWEINSNPVITLTQGEYKPVHLAHQEWFAAQILEALLAIDQPPCDERIPIRLRLDELSAVQV